MHVQSLDRLLYLLLGRSCPIRTSETVQHLVLVSKRHELVEAGTGVDDRPARIAIDVAGAIRQGGRDENKKETSLDSHRVELGCKQGDLMSWQNGSTGILIFRTCSRLLMASIVTQICTHQMRNVGGLAKCIDVGGGEPLFGSWAIEPTSY